MERMLLSLVLITAIARDDKEEKEIAAIPMHFEIVWLGSLFIKTSDADLSKPCRKHPYFFISTVNDGKRLEIRNGLIFPDELSVNLRCADIHNEIHKSLGDFSAERKELKRLFQHIRCYFPKFEPPRVVTLISRVDYEPRAIHASTLLLTGADNYLEAKHLYYQGMQQYISTELDKQYLTVDVAETFASRLVPRRVRLTFLDNMIYEGKRLYLKSLLMPDKKPATLLKYTSDRYDWVGANEVEIWRYSIEKELLRQIDRKLLSRFLYPAPFSKFYLELDNQSSGQIRRYIGYQIAQAYAENCKDTPLVNLLAIRADEPFKQSLYEPK